MNHKSALILVAIFATIAHGLPVTKPKKEVEEEPQPATPDVASALEYERYLKEVVGALESDPEFRRKLDKAPEADIRSGKIAQELEYVNHNVRTKLDEIKRRELERLRGLANKEYELTNDIDRDHLKVSQHLDIDNDHTFEIDDLRKLIKKTSEDLAEADRQRRAEFKEYEMQKEFERETKLKEMDEEHRKKYEEELKEQQEKHNKHEKVHHPGNKAQLEEVWEKQDHMDKQDFDPRTFFMMHDVDGNGFWDETEVKALFVKELDKVYQSGLPEDDMRERAEEMERMREHVFKETDTNHDDLISFQEFLDQTKREEFKKDPDWATVDQQTQYTHDEYLEFERRRQEEIQRMIAQGQLQPHPNMPQGYYPSGQHPAPVYPQQPQMHYQNPQQQYQQQQQQYQQQQLQYQQQQQQLLYQQQQQQQYQQQQQLQYQQQPQPVKLHPNQLYEVPQQNVAQQEPSSVNANPQNSQAQYLQKPQDHVQQQQHVQQSLPQGQTQQQNPQHVPLQQLSPQQVPQQPQVPPQNPQVANKAPIIEQQSIQQSPTNQNSNENQNIPKN